MVLFQPNLKIRADPSAPPGAWGQRPQNYRTEQTTGWLVIVRPCCASCVNPPLTHDLGILLRPLRHLMSHQVTVCSIQSTGTLYG
jgi:hypothetical protein